jgi:hypothetical protein
MKQQYWGLFLLLHDWTRRKSENLFIGACQEQQRLLCVDSTKLSLWNPKLTIYFDVRMMSCKKIVLRACNAIALPWFTKQWRSWANGNNHMASRSGFRIQIGARGISEKAINLMQFTTYATRQLEVFTGRLAVLYTLESWPFLWSFERAFHHKARNGEHEIIWMDFQRNFSANNWRWLRA